MTQVLIELDPATLTPRIALNELGHISLEGGLETSCLLSLGSDQRAAPSDPVVHPRGWWGDDFPEVAGDRYGSRLWIVRAVGKLGTAGLRRGQLAIEQSLAWMIEDGIAKSVSVEVERQGDDILAASTVIVREDGRVYEDIWEVHVNGV